MSLNWIIKLRKQAKPLVQKVENVQLITVSRMFKKFGLGCNNIDNQARSSKSKSVDSETSSHRGKSTE